MAKQEPNGRGYDSFAEAFKAGKIDWGGRSRVLVTNKEGITIGYVCLCDGRLKTPAICYDDRDESKEILGEDNPWRFVTDDCPESSLIAGFGLERLTQQA